MSKETKILSEWGRAYKLNALSLKLFKACWPNSRITETYVAVLRVFLAQKISGNPLTVVRDGKQGRNFTYVTNVV